MLRKNLFFVLALCLAAVPTFGDGTFGYEIGEGDIQVNFFEPSQTFTAECTGVASIALAFAVLNPDSPNLPVTVTLYEGEGTGGSVLGTATLTLPEQLPGTGDSPVFFEFPVTASGLIVDNIYTISVRTDTTKIGTLVGEPKVNEPLYPGGVLLIDGEQDPSFCSPANICDMNFRVTPASIFADGFESGDTAGWSSQSAQP